MATIAKLAERKQKLEEELAEVKAEIAARHGETDTTTAAPAEAPPPPKPKRTTKKT